MTDEWSEETVQGVGTDLVNGIIAGITAQAYTVWQSVTAFSNAILNTMVMILSARALVNSGKNLVIGLWNGIASESGWLHSNLKSWCDGVIATIEDGFDIHSPSRVMRDRVGYMLGAGVSEGIMESYGLVRNAMTGLVNAAAITDVIGSMGAGVRSGANVTGGIDPSGDLAAAVASALNGAAVQMDGAAVGRLVLPGVSAALNDQVSARRYL